MSDHLPWRMDGYVVCPSCGNADDGAAMFGDSDMDSSDRNDWGLFDGLVGRCTYPGCGAEVRLRLETVAPPGSAGSGGGTNEGGG